MANRVYNRCGVNVEGMNARQAFLKCKQGTPSFEIPKVKKCVNEPPEEINVYSDGSLINTRTNSFKLAGAGVWWPNRKHSGICVRTSDQPLSEAELDLAFARQKEDGLELSVAIAGMGGSSTRAEIAAGIIAMAADCEVHMGTDSKAFMDRAKIILQMIKEQRKPKRPWSTQKDGDLWQICCEMEKIKGHNNIQISKVKGHATDKNIQDGIATLKDKRGNDRADSAADEGVTDHSDGICKISRIQAKSQHAYICFTKAVHNHILEAFYKRKYLESVENKEAGHGEQQASGKTTCKHVKIGETQYSQEVKGPGNRILTGVGNMGETMCKYKKAYNVHKFLDKCLVIPTKDGEDGISWQDLFS